MSVLATKMTNAMSKRAGYLPFNGLMDENLMYYTFKDCIKIEHENFRKWVLYWEDFPMAVVCDVKADKLVNGFVKVAILNKTIVPVEEIGLYMHRKTHMYGDIVKGEFRTKSQAEEFVRSELLKGADVQTTTSTASTSKKEQKVTLSNAEISNLKEVMAKNWGITLK